MTREAWLAFLVLFIHKSSPSFWNEIPQRCTYDRTTLFSCWNTTFVHPIPLFNEMKYTLQSHDVQIRDSYFQLSLNELFTFVGPNIERLTLTNNTFSTDTSNQSAKIYFRVLQTLEIHDDKGVQWSQLNSSYYPQLIQLDLSSNQFTEHNQLVFDQLHFHVLKHLNLSHNRLHSLSNLTGTALSKLESITLSFNPLETVLGKMQAFQSLILLDLSFTPIKQLFDLRLLPRLEIFLCRYCYQISMAEYRTFLTNCSEVRQQLTLDLSASNITSVKPFNSCVKSLTLSDQETIDSISADDFLSNTNLENIQLRNINQLTSVHLNVYDRLRFIDFSDNIRLSQVRLRPMSDYSYLTRLAISHTGMTQFAVDFNQTMLRFLHVDTIDLSDNRLETLDFLSSLTFYSLDVSRNRLKIIDIAHIQFRHGMYELSLMNSLNLSSNQLESVDINWADESPHTIDLSNNQLQSVRLHGQSTYVLLLNNNSKLTLPPANFTLDLPGLRYLDLSSIDLQSLENLIYLHNLSAIYTLALSHNQLQTGHRTLNWNIFYPWRGNLTHLYIQNMSIENIDAGIDLTEFYHLLTINLFGNDKLKCDCTLHPFIQWLKTPPPPLSDFYEPLNKVFSVYCPISLVDLPCGGRRTSSIWFYVLLNIGLALIIGGIIITVACRLIRKRGKPYRLMFSEPDAMALHERDMLEKIDDEM